ncbi:hypothetical protein [Pelomonas sp. KK5]|uniref:vWA domain-containing protein n=1 Tax=Pelomonas sp. KK5 TaxID=1855730 RepID=UPI0011804249|nr:hypothetical protein [Pelomonas sp. KK5]
MKSVKTQPKQGKRELEELPWYKKTSAILKLAAAILTAGVAFFTLVNLVKRDPPSALVNVVILYDASSESLGGLRDSTKGDILKLGIADTLHKLSDKDNLGLRSFGGSCDDGSHLLVPIGMDNRELIAKAIEQTKFHGKRNIVRAIADSTTDFNDQARFKEKTRRIVVITGGIDECIQFEDAIAELQRRITDTGIAVDLRVIGVALNDVQRRSLTKMVSSLHGKANFANSSDELVKLTDSAIRGLGDEVQRESQPLAPSQQSVGSAAPSPENVASSTVPPGDMLGSLREPGASPTLTSTDTARSEVAGNYAQNVSVVIDSTEPFWNQIRQCISRRSMMSSEMISSQRPKYDSYPIDTLFIVSRGTPMSSGVSQVKYLLYRKYYLMINNSSSVVDSTRHTFTNGRTVGISNKYPPPRDISGTPLMPKETTDLLQSAYNNELAAVLVTKEEKIKFESNSMHELWPIEFSVYSLASRTPLSAKRAKGVEILQKCIQESESALESFDLVIPTTADIQYSVAP